MTFDSGGGNAGGYDGPISGNGTVQIRQGEAAGKFRDSPLVLGGRQPNTMKGAWLVKSGRLTLAKNAGIDAVGGTIDVGGQGDNDCLYWANSDQVNDAAVVELRDSPKGGATLNLNGCHETFARLTIAPHTRIVTGDEKSGGVLTVGTLGDRRQGHSHGRLHVGRALDLGQRFRGRGRREVDRRRRRYRQREYDHRREQHRRA